MIAVAVFLTTIQSIIQRSGPVYNLEFCNSLLANGSTSVAHVSDELDKHYTTGDLIIVHTPPFLDRDQTWDDEVSIRYDRKLTPEEHASLRGAMLCPFYCTLWNIGLFRAAKNEKVAAGGKWWFPISVNVAKSDPKAYAEAAISRNLYNVCPEWNDAKVLGYVRISSEHPIDAICGLTASVKCGGGGKGPEMILPPKNTFQVFEQDKMYLQGDVVTSSDLPEHLKYIEVYNMNLRPDKSAEAKADEDFDKLRRAINKAKVARQLKLNVDKKAADKRKSVQAGLKRLELDIGLLP